MIDMTGAMGEEVVEAGVAGQWSAAHHKFCSS